MVLSSNTPSEVEIATLLESWNILCVEEQKQQVHPRVEHAQQMCAELHSKELHSEQQNSQPLEGRYQWVLAKLYRCIGDYEKAKART